MVQNMIIYDDYLPIFIFKYNGKRGTGMKAFFTYFIPLTFGYFNSRSNKMAYLSAFECF